MRLAFVSALLLALCAPLAASARPTKNPAMCRHIAAQLVHYDAMKVQAHEDGRDLWARRFADHIGTLEEHFEDKCPEQYAQQKTTQQLAELLKTAGRAALTFFTLGLY